AGMLIRKGGFDEIKGRGLGAFRDSILQMAPYFGTRVDELQDWDQVKLLSVQINRLRRWHLPGLLCIGDAAHAMSPAGGVGINLAIQDAVATSNLLARPLQRGHVAEAELAAVQRRREFPARATQAAQVRIHNGFASVFANPGPIQAPWQLKVVVQIPGLRQVLGYAVGMGVRPEHVREATHPRVPLLSRLAIAVGRTLGTAVSMLSHAGAQRNQRGSSIAQRTRGIESGGGGPAVRAST
ncbi:MAG: FAD-dependent monooxygenase, partial [Acidobacteriaceae bacterium]|nr:FAD-dependent monooxygenase [Acidobacteriaceae bacterium]